MYFALADVIAPILGSAGTVINSHQEEVADKHAVFSTDKVGEGYIEEECAYPAHGIDTLQSVPSCS